MSDLTAVLDACAVVTRVSPVRSAASMLGLNQAGLAETIQFVLCQYPAVAQQRLAQNVFLTGGVANIPGLGARLERELREMRPFQSRWESAHSVQQGSG